MKAPSMRTMLHHCAWGLVFGFACVGATAVIRAYRGSFVMMIAAVVILGAAMVVLQRAPSPSPRRRSRP